MVFNGKFQLGFYCGGSIVLVVVARCYYYHIHRQPTFIRINKIKFAFFLLCHVYRMQQSLSFFRKQKPLREGIGKLCFALICFDVYIR